MRLCLATIVALAISTGCSDTGVLTEVAFEGESLVVDELKFFIGAQTAEDGSFEPAAQTPIVVELENRDLANGTFTVLFRAGDFGDIAVKTTPLVVAAIAVADGQQVAYGRVPNPVRFVDGETRRYRIELSTDEYASVTSDGCVYAAGTRLINWQNDQDCDGDVAEVDCDDNHSGIGPSSQEICDGIDNNCNGACDEGVDRDGDGFDGCNKPLNATCSNAGDPRTEWDCDDDDDKINPAAVEVCDGIDNNCDRHCDDVAADNNCDRHCDDVAADNASFPEGYFTCDGGVEDTPDAYTGEAHVCEFPSENCDCFDDPASSETCPSVLTSPTMDLVCNAGCGESSLCFTPTFEGADDCVAGTFGECGFGECTPGSNLASVPRTLCEYGPTSAEGVENALQAIAMDAPNFQTVECKAGYVPELDGNRVCPVSIDIPPAPGALTECHWTIWGGDRYHLGFEGDGLRPTTFNGACDAGARLLVQDTLDPVPAHDTVRILHQYNADQLPAQVVHTVHLTPIPVEECADIAAECVVSPAPLP